MINFYVVQFSTIYYLWNILHTRSMINFCAVRFSTIYYLWNTLHTCVNEKYIVDKTRQRSTCYKSFQIIYSQNLKKLNKETLPLKSIAMFVDRSNAV